MYTALVHLRTLGKLGGIKKVTVSVYCLPQTKGQLVVMRSQTLEEMLNGAGIHMLSSRHIFCESVE